MATKPSKTTAGKRTPRAKAGVLSVRTEEKRRAAWRLANEKGFNCPQIAEAIGVTRQRAWQLISEELVIVQGETFAEAIEWRLTQTAGHLADLRLLDEIAAQAKLDKDLKILVSVVKERRALRAELSKLWGAYAPTKTDITTGGDALSPAMQVFAVPLQDASVQEWLLKHRTP